VGQKVSYRRSTYIKRTKKLHRYVLQSVSKMSLDPNPLKSSGNSMSQLTLQSVMLYFVFMGFNGFLL
jgi:hypothetical protein